ncbi:MAG: alkaline phosphatase family protein [Ardenticatenaceae bacterium]|nr:alkaline phosphatase family protein [Ardenticatenaceae bacterium]
MHKSRFIHLFFLDGVGLGGADPDINPFVTANLPTLTGLLGAGWYTTRQPIITQRASLVPTDANLNMPHKPQSATGQATILTGRNVPELVGEHYGPKPNPAVQAVIAEGTLFKEVVDADGQAALITPYPQGYFDAVARGKRLLSAVPLAAVEAGLSLMTADDLRNGRAVSPGFTGQGWHDHLGYTDIPLFTLDEAGRHIARIATRYQFSFFEHWPSDRAGHRGSLADAAAHLEMIDAVLGGLLAAWDDQNGLLILTSDHGNIEEKDQRQHTRNPVPTLLVGAGHAELAAQIVDLRDIAKVTRHFLDLPIPIYV